MTPVVNALRTVQLDRDITLFLLRLVDHVAIADCLRQVGMVQKHVSRIEVSRLVQQGRVTTCSARKEPHASAPRRAG